MTDSVTTPATTTPGSPKGPRALVSAIVLLLGTAAGAAGVQVTDAEASTVVAAGTALVGAVAGLFGVGKRIARRLRETRS